MGGAFRCCEGTDGTVSFAMNSPKHAVLDGCMAGLADKRVLEETMESVTLRRTGQTVAGLKLP